MNANFSRFDSGHLRLLAWLGLSGVLILGLYGQQVFTLTSGLDSLLTQTLGTDYPAYPFLALLLLLTALRWKDFHRILVSEKGLTSKPMVRLLGAGMVVGPAAIWRLAFESGLNDVYLEMELAAVTIVLVSYGTLLLLNPSMARIMFPYAALYGAGLVSPLLMLDLLGGPLSTLSTYLTAAMVNLIGIPVVWNGPVFAFWSATGDHIVAVISPVCSAAYSISIYLSLIGLMYLDLRRDVRFTALLAVVGVMALPIINSFRIAVDIWVGSGSGLGAFETVHDWLGYILFFSFYLVVLYFYSRGPMPAAVGRVSATKMGSEVRGEAPSSMPSRGTPG